MIATFLKDRILLGDGTCVVDPEQVPMLLLQGVPPNKIMVSEFNDDIIEFNKRVSPEIKVFQEQATGLDKTWLIPEEYLNLDLKQYFYELVKDKSDEDLIRVENELVEVYNRGFENGLKTIIYVVDIFKKSKQVWGVGRGSSCASYLLYLIGLHCVNPRKYNIHWSEFFHE